MKKSYLILLLIIFGFTNKSKKKTDFEDLKLNGNVKSIIENTYKAEEKFGEISKGEKLITLIDTENHTIIFNEQGNIVEEKNHLIYYKIQQIYDNQNNKEIVNTYDKNNKLTSQTKYKYDSNGNFIEYNQYYEGKLVHKGKFKYDDEEKPIEHNFYDQTGKLQSKRKNIYKNKEIVDSKDYDGDGNLEFQTVFEYDSNGNETKMTNFNSLGDINQKIMYKYNSENIVIESIDLYNNISKKEKYKYIFDSNKNWIQKIVFEDEIPMKIIERNIQYN